MLTIVALTESHNRKSFNCGRPALNDFLIKRALSPYFRTYVVVPERTSSEIIAFFTISPDPTEIIRGDYKAGGLLTRLVKLEYLAVDNN